MTSTGGRRSGPGLKTGKQPDVPSHPFMPKPDTDPGDEEPESIDTVEAWRFDQLVTAGYPVELAQDLARNPRVDLHYAVELAGRTTPDLAYQILT